MSNKYIHLFNTISSLNDYIETDYHEPFVSLTEETRVDYNRHPIINNNGYDYIDLGLPSGILWATCNIGASNFDDLGDRFAYGEVSPKESYAYNNYVFYNNNKYGSENSVLELEDDAAHVNWGGGWRMPTKQDFVELVNNTTKEWTTSYSNAGIILRSNINNNFIFVPAGGISYASNRPPVSGVGEYCYLRSSGKHDSDYSSIFNASASSTTANTFLGCPHGTMIRPVIEPSPNIVEIPS